MQNDLDPKGLLAAMVAYHKSMGNLSGHANAVETAIRTYLSAVPDGEGELVERLENIIAHRIDLGSTPRAIAEQCAEAASRLSQAGVRVKPLEWDANGDAKTALATYHVEKGMFGWQWSCFSGAGGFAGAKPLGGELEAKAAAQADYEQRILSALQTEQESGE